MTRCATGHADLASATRRPACRPTVRLAPIPPASAVDQIRILSAIVERRYRLLRTATALTWAGIVLTMCAAIAQRLWGAVGHSGTSAGADWT